MNLGGGFPNNPEDLFTSIFEEKKDRDNGAKETMVAFMLIAFCISCLVIGLFTLKKTADTREKEGGQLVSTLLGDKVAVIGLEGVITDDFYNKSPFATKLNAAAVKKELLDAAEKSTVKGVLLRVNSPGGTVGASQELYQLVEKVRKAGKPVVVSVGDMCASGCYYLASAADKIVANPGSITGSIGVISSSYNYMGLFEKLGLRDQTFKAGKFKDLGSGTRNMTEEEKAIMQALLDDSYDQFLTDIEKGRKIPREELDKIAQGLIYTGKQALAVNLVDDLGSYQDSKRIMRKLLEDEYDYKKSGKIDFEKTWEQRRLNAFEDFFGFGFPDSMLQFFGLNSRAAEIIQPHSFSKYQPLWLLQ